jgi:hypothetical protein
VLQIVLAAEIMVAAPDFGHFEPMVDATQRELAAAGVTETPATPHNRFPRNAHPPAPAATHPSPTIDHAP